MALDEDSQIQKRQHIKTFKYKNNLTPVLHLYIRFKPRLKRLETAIKESVHKHSITGFPLLTQRAKQPS